MGGTDKDSETEKDTERERVGEREREGGGGDLEPQLH